MKIVFRTGEEGTNEPATTEIDIIDLQDFLDLLKGCPIEDMEGTEFKYSAHHYNFEKNYLEVYIDRVE